MSSPLMLVLLREMARYNVLLAAARSDVSTLQKALCGALSMCEHEWLRELAQSLSSDCVPKRWTDARIAYATPKALSGDSGWVSDLRRRCEQLSKWASYGKPKVFWLSGFQFAPAFLIALKQSMAKRQSAALQQIEWEFNVINNANDLHGKTIQMHPKQGAYIYGLHLQGSAWDFNAGTLCEPSKMLLFQEMPVIHFKPIIVSSSKSSHQTHQQSHFKCPVYLFATNNPKLLCHVNLKTGKQTPAFWAKRGTALLLSLPH